MCNSSSSSINELLVLFLLHLDHLISAFRVQCREGVRVQVYHYLPLLPLRLRFLLLPLLLLYLRIAARLVYITINSSIPRLHHQLFDVHRALSRVDDINPLTRQKMEERPPLPLLLPSSPLDHQLPSIIVFRNLFSSNDNYFILMNRYRNCLLNIDCSSSSRGWEKR